MANFKDKTILITGGTGSFGGSFVNFLQDKEFKELRIFSRDELKQEQMRQKFNNSKIKFYIGDIRDRSSVDDAMIGVNYIFHAAALKQVPTCELFPMQAMQTNVVGSQNVIASAIQNEVEKVVSLSTDKAVYPVNALGNTKAIMERIIQSAARSIPDGKTVLSVVRYGNILFTRGSVIPIFIKQIREQLPLTLTVPEMSRFWLSLSEAVELVNFSLEHGRQGDIFIRKAPSCTLGDVAQAIKSIFKSKSVIKTIGMRHGEKMHETLATKEELVRSEDMGDFLRLSMDTRGLNYEKYLSEGENKIVQLQDYGSENSKRMKVKEIEKMLLAQPEIISALKS